MQVEVRLAEHDEEQATPDSVVAALRELMQSEGWRLLREQADREWGPTGMGRRLAEAIETVAAGPNQDYELADTVKRTYGTAQAVMALVKWPEEVIRARTQNQSTPLTSVMDRMRAGLRRRTA